MKSRFWNKKLQNSPFRNSIRIENHIVIVRLDVKISEQIHQSHKGQNQGRLDQVFLW